METLIKDKKISVSLFILLVIVSLFFIAKIVGEVKGNFGDDPSYNVISVSGKGEAIAVSNIATLNINLEEETDTSKKAQELLNESINKTLSYLTEHGIEAKDIKSTFGGISPRYEYVKSYYSSGERKLVGFTARQSIEVKVREVDNANTIRTGLAEIGVDNIDGPNFSIDNEDGYKEEARAKAITNAKEKATVLARDLGVKLVRIVSFSEGSNYYPYRESSMKVISAVAMDESGAYGIEEDSSPSLPTGENEITSNVTITYEIR